MEEKLPNILLVVADQHRSDCLGAAGNPDVKTPHLDSLAEQGVLFENCFCASPLCTPARYSVLTGLYPHQHLGWGNRSTIPPQLPTFPKQLRDRGYHTMAVGKMHLTPARLDVGFERMQLAEQDGPGRFADDYHAYLRDLDLLDAVDIMDQRSEYRGKAPESYWRSFGAVESNLAEEHHSTAWIGRQALDEVERWEGGGNFLLASFIKPHHPFDPPASWSGMYDPERLTLLPGFALEVPDRDFAMHRGYFDNRTLSEGVLRRVMAHYYAAISHIDHYVGKLIGRLVEKGLYNDTMIIFTGDHGEYMGFHHLLLKQNYMYDPVVKVPLIVKFPGARRAGERHAGLVSHIDIGRTVLAAVGAAELPDSQGLDLSQDGVEREFIFAEEHRGRQYMIRTRTRKLMLTRDRQRSVFVDLERDPLEWDNLYGDPERAGEIGALKEHLAETVLFAAPAPDYQDVHGAPVTAPEAGAVFSPTEMETWMRERMQKILG